MALMPPQTSETPELDRLGPLAAPLAVHRRLAGNGGTTEKECRTSRRSPATTRRTPRPTCHSTPDPHAAGMNVLPFASADDKKRDAASSDIPSNTPSAKPKDHTPN
jgi:hypothetical protein